MSLLAAAGSRGPVISGPVLVTLLIGGGVIFSFGYAMAVWRRARDDYKRTKAGLSGMRKAKWTLWRAAVRAGFWIFVAFVVLVTWVVSDVRAEQEAKPGASPTPSVSATIRPARR
jgi:hypothetical protein